MKKVKVKQVRVIHKKLGRVRINKVQVDGYADPNTNTAYIDERLESYYHLYVLVHEIMHLQNPNWEENEVEAYSTQLSELLWHENYRKVIL